MNYLQRVTYSALALVDSVINLIISISGLRTFTELSGYYWFFVQESKIAKEKAARQERRDKLEKEFEQKTKEAFASLDLKDPEEPNGK